MQRKKFIAPGGWFSLTYPGNWSEFEDTEGTFLFYNPEKWTGNFRISAFKKDTGKPGAMGYAQEVLEAELSDNHQATVVEIGKFRCVYYKKTIQEEGNWYITHIWITGKDNLVFECSFTVPKGMDHKEALEIIATLEIRKEGIKYPREIISIRVLEILTVNEQYDWVVKALKKYFKKDFNGNEKDIDKIQVAIEKQLFKTDHRSSWQALGIAFGVILTNEIEGMDWVTVVEGSREIPAVCYKDTSLVIYPLDLIWEKMKSGQSLNISDEYKRILESVSTLEKN